MTKNPYTRVEKTFKFIGDVLLILFSGLMVALLFVVYPIVELSAGGDALSAFGPHIWTAGLIVFFILLLLALYGWDKLVADPWRKRREAWETAEAARLSTLPLDPEPWLWDGKRYAWSTKEHYLFRPRTGYNPHYWNYGRDDD